MFDPGSIVHIAKLGENKTVVQPYNYSGEWAYVLERDGTQDRGWREDELTLVLPPQVSL